MRQKILNILTYISQAAQKERDLFYDAMDIWQELLESGYTEEEIEGALGHIEKMALNEIGKYWSDEFPVYRAFSEEEKVKITSRGRGYLWGLKSKGVIDHALEDEIVHKAMNLDRPAGIREIKTVAALTIFGYEHRVYVDKEEWACRGSFIN